MKRFIATESELPTRDCRVDWITQSGHTVEGGSYEAAAKAWHLPNGTLAFYTPKAWRLSERQ